MDTDGFLPFIGISRHRLATDGEGVTTLAAFHGCPLACRYCLNPQCRGDEFDRIAVDVVKSMPRWMPAQRNGNRINCKYTIAVRFGQGKRR